ncbi:MAG: methyl-accepting chemotaxis protein [Betaproteobacteria bacterium]
MKSMKQLFGTALLCLLAAVALLWFSLYQVGTANKDLSDAYTTRYRSVLLADELRQSSDDLTRLARTYVVSGDPLWEQQYFEILDIRNGKRPRPAGYEKIYWDFRAVGTEPSGGSHQGATTSVPLLEMMKHAGFTDAEFAKLKEAAGNSDDLVKTETIAMNMVKGLYEDGKGGFTRKAPPDFAKARAMMHDADYHRFKAKIMKPVDEFFTLLDQRTEAAVVAAMEVKNFWYAVVIACAGLVAVVGLGSLWYARLWIGARLGADPSTVREVAENVAAGRLDREVPVQLGDETSVMARMALMLNALRHAAAEASENLRIRRSLDAASTSAMIADDTGAVFYANPSMVQLLTNAETDLRTAMPDFAAASIIGSNLSGFERVGARAVGRTEVQAGRRHFTIDATPIVDGTGRTMGTTVQWTDRTAEVATEREIARTIESAGRGNLQARVATEGKNGFFLLAAEGLNRILEATDRGVTEVGRVSRALADGDLTQKVTGEFEGQFASLQADSNATSERLREVIGQIREAAESITQSSSEIATGNQDLSGRTEEQVASLEEAASSMEELTSTVKQNAENARQANALAVGASEVAQRGGAVVQEVVQTMSGINESSKKIADIISVIDGIAFQTNILALNAAVEAARAGEQGRGFAVVATEVRNLAQRSAAAAKEIKELISDSVNKVESGSRLVDSAGRTMGEIVASVKRVTDIMAEITAASVEQSSGIEQVNQTIMQMDEMTQHNATLVEQASAAAESLASQAVRLSETVSLFRVSDAGGLAPEAGWDGKHERRGPDRARNVARLPRAEDGASHRLGSTGLGGALKASQGTPEGASHGSREARSAG